MSFPVIKFVEMEPDLRLLAMMETLTTVTDATNTAKSSKVGIARVELLSKEITVSRKFHKKLC